MCMCSCQSFVGNESEAVVEFAPFQKVPPEKKKVDPRAGTITEGTYLLLNISSIHSYGLHLIDEDYLSFIASLQQPTLPETDKQPPLVPPAQEEPTTAPLIAALLAEKSNHNNASSKRHGHDHKESSQRSHFERIQREKAEEILEFRRNPLPTTAPVVMQIATRPQGQEKSRAGSSSKPSHAEQSDNTNAATSSRKQRGGGGPGGGGGGGALKASPSPARHQRGGKGSGGASASAPPEASTTASSATGTDPTAGPPSSSTQRPARPPKFKFDAVLAAATNPTPTPATNRPSARGGNSNPNQKPATATAPSDPIATDVTTEGTTPTIGEPGAGQSKRAKQRAKAREREKEKKVTDEVGPSSSSGVPSSTLSVLSAPPKILLRPTARIDDDDAGFGGSAPPAGPGIIPIQIPLSAARGGHGGGRGGRGPRGGGAGRGGNRADPPPPPSQST